MKERLLDLLACPTCGGDILLAYASKYDDKEIIEGVLTCKKCDREYKVVRGVPRFADLGKIEADKAETAENFGWQWTNFTQEDPKYNDQFLGWLQPVKPEFFKDKVVLEGGCGKGRHTKLAAEWGAKEVVGIDLGDGVESAFASDPRSAERTHCSVRHLQTAAQESFRLCVQRWRPASHPGSKKGVSLAGFEGPTRRPYFGLDIRGREQRMDHEICKPDPRKLYVKDEPADALSAFKTSDAQSFSDN